MSRGLTPALDYIGNDKYNGLSGRGQLAQSGHAYGVADGSHSSVIQAVPILGKARRVGNGRTGDKNVGAVRQYCTHESLSVFKVKLHILIS